MEVERGIHTVPATTAYFNAIAHSSLAIPTYPLPRFSSKNLSLLKIDNEDYYEGEYKKALKSSTSKYQMHILAEHGMPESIEQNPDLVLKELDTISNIIDKSFEELHLVSY